MRVGVKTECGVHKLLRHSLLYYVGKVCTIGEGSGPNIAADKKPPAAALQWSLEQWLLVQPPRVLRCQSQVENPPSLRPVTLLQCPCMAQLVPHFCTVECPPVLCHFKVRLVLHSVCSMEECPPVHHCSRICQVEVYNHVCPSPLYYSVLPPRGPI